MKPTPTNPGMKNIYTCTTCGQHIVTRDTVDGVTPFIISCQCGCSGRMQSSLYRVFDPDNILRPSHEWYRPSALEIVKPHLADHVSKGGLLLRVINPDRKPELSKLIRHVKRGSVYRILNAARLQADGWHDAKGTSVDMREGQVYESLDDGSWWFRSNEEMGDGRFEELVSGKA